MNAVTRQLLKKYAPVTLADLAGQPVAVEQLATFAADPFEGAFIFHGPTGVGKTCAARALAFDLGCSREWEDMGGITSIPAGEQDGKAVKELLRSLCLRPLYGSGWKTAIINEADCMTPQAEAIWLDGLENLPPKSVVVFTTNELRRMSERFVGRCEVIEFDGTSPMLRKGMESFVRRVWKAETGERLHKIPENLGRFELADETYSIRLALQQIAPMIRAGKTPDKVAVPFIRTEADFEAEKWRDAGLKAAETRRRNASKAAS